MVLVGSHGEIEKDGSNDEVVVDYRGNPVDKSRTGGWLAAGLILGCEFSERICVVGISMNLVTYLVGNLHISAAKSATIVTNFMGTLNLLGLLGGFLADAKLSRYVTVAISASITALGVILLTLATTIPSMRPPLCDDYRRQHHECIEANDRQLALLYAALYTIALGGGGIKSNVSGFGSDQFDIKDPKEEKAMIFFFNRFYFGVSIGSLFSVIVLVYVQDNVGRGWGYGISAGTMVIAVAVLLCGTPWYRFKKPQGSPLTAKGSLHKKIKCLDKAAVLDDGCFAGTMSKDDRWIVSTVTQVEEVKMIVKLLPIWSTCILFWTIYSQMTTFTVHQATIMHRTVSSFVIPAGSFSSFLIATILLFTSLNEKVFIPLSRKLTHNVQGITSLQRIGIGLVFSIAAMVGAAIVEKERREIAVQKEVKISAFWLLIQFFLVGTGEAFAYVGQLEFFIREAPDRMKSMSTGLFLSTISMGFFVSSLLVSIVDHVTGQSWLRSNLNEGKLNNFYWLLAMLGFLNLVVFLILASRHQYRRQLAGEKELESLDDVEKMASIKSMEIVEP
ncbi:hypothetical protein V6N13_071855 [Hibiscus sabdariffa]|uniref:Uncharacterized protein n=1 Tax=Hibiscus sabdariffa TaxID=183260 RepID=A0ABR2TCT6_9ROSI